MSLSHSGSKAKAPGFENQFLDFPLGHTRPHVFRTLQALNGDGPQENRARPHLPITVFACVLFPVPPGRALGKALLGPPRRGWARRDLLWRGGA